MKWEESKRADLLIFDLAFYEVCEGMTLCTEKALKLREKAQEMFWRFKRQIQLGEFTLEELQDEIASKYSAVITPKKEFKLSEVAEFVKHLEEEEEKKEKHKEETHNLYSNISGNDILSALFYGKKKGDEDEFEAGAH